MKKEEMLMRRSAGLAGVILVLGFFIVGCNSYTIPDKNRKVITENSCEGCHIDYERLIEVHTPDTGAPAAGCGGEAPSYEPYDRVYLGGAGYETFQEDPNHYNIACTTCHGGIGDSGDKDEAHSADWTDTPSADFQENCGSCHAELTENFTTSIHNGTGQKRKVAMRHGGESSADWENLSEEHKDGYNQKCATCHGTCGNCHITRPELGGGGLAKGHTFYAYDGNKNLDMINICVTCHKSRGGHAFLGQAAGTEPDVHQQAGYTCLDCHDGHELHGDGVPVEQRYAYTELPTCSQCHGDKSESNTYHSEHYDDFSCYVCHSQDYNNCGSCHVGGEGARVGHYQDFKLAINPIPEVKSGFNSDITVVRRTLGAPDNWKEYGVEEYASFDVFPTYNYTTPHNILKWTTRTEVEGEKGCGSSCHMKITGSDTINKELYLFKSDLLEWEIGATEFMTMDENMPEKFMKSN